MIAPDSSIVIAALAHWHVQNAAARDALAGSDVQLVAHVAFETTSALSRMPEGRRIAPSVVVEALTRRFPSTWLALDAARARSALERAVAAGVRGGSLYDALIAATAAEHGARILSADRCAQPTYEAIGAEAAWLAS